VLAPLLGVALWVSAAAPVLPQAATPVEAHELQALFLYNFTKFVTWPPDAFEDDRAPFRICIVGREPRLREFLEALTERESVDRRPLVVEERVRIRDTDGCQIVYVPAYHDHGDLADILGPRYQTVLTVGDGEGFLEAGGVLQLITVEQKIRLRINEEERERMRLRMSSRLLQLCDRVRPAAGGPAGGSGWAGR
jgi:hypothetical protein